MTMTIKHRKTSDAPRISEELRAELSVQLSVRVRTMGAIRDTVKTLRSVLQTTPPSDAQPLIAGALARLLDIMGEHEAQELKRLLDLLTAPVVAPTRPPIETVN